MSKWVTVREFAQPHEAMVAQSILESEGITTFMKDEMTIGLHNYYSPSPGTMKLQVPDPEAVRADEILTDAGYLRG